MKRFTIFALLLLLVAALLAAPAFAQVEQPLLAAPKPAQAGVPALPPPAKPAAPAVPQSGMPVPAEIQELLADRDLLSAEIERIISAEGEAVKIPVSLRTLSARREAKTQRFLAWLDANKIPREWTKVGWRIYKWVFIPPPTSEVKKEEEKP